MILLHAAYSNIIDEQRLESGSTRSERLEITPARTGLSQGSFYDPGALLCWPACGPLTRQGRPRVGLMRHEASLEV